MGINTYRNSTDGYEYAQGVAWAQEHQYQEPPGVRRRQSGAGGVIAGAMGATWMAGEAVYRMQDPATFAAERFTARIASNMPRGAKAIGSLIAQGGGEFARGAGHVGRKLTTNKQTWFATSPSTLLTGFKHRSPMQHLAMIPHHIGDWFLPSSVNDFLVPGGVRRGKKLDKWSRAAAKQMKALSKEESNFSYMLSRAGSGAGMIGKGLGFIAAPALAAGFIGANSAKYGAPLGLSAATYGAEAAAWGIGWGVGGFLGSSAAAGLGIGGVAATTLTAVPALGLAIGASAIMMHETEAMYSSISKRAGHVTGVAFGGIGKPTFGQQTYTMRQQALSSIQRSPLNDRARLMGNEATIAHI